MHCALPDLGFKNVHYNNIKVVLLWGVTQATEHQRAKQRKRKMRGMEGRRSEGLHGLRTATINCWCCVCSSQRLFCQRNAGLGSGRERRIERWQRKVITGQRGTSVYQADHTGQRSSFPDAPSPPDQSMWGHTVDMKVCGSQVAQDAQGDLHSIVY